MTPPRRHFEPGRRVPTYIPTEEDKAPKRASIFGPLVRLESWIEAHPLARLLGRVLAVLTIFATLATLYSANVQMVAMTEEREAREQERLARLRAELYRRAPGESGKGVILNELVGMNAIESVIDLSCERVGRWVNDWCSEPPQITGLTITSESPWRGVTDGMTLDVSGVDLVDANLDGLGSFEAPFVLFAENALFRDGNIRYSFVRGNMINAHINGADLSGSTLAVSVDASTYIAGNLSGARIDIVNSMIWNPSDPTWIVVLETDPAIPFCNDGRRFAAHVYMHGSYKSACVDDDEVPIIDGWHWGDRPLILEPDVRAVLDEDKQPIICDPRDLGAVSPAPNRFEQGPLTDDDVIATCTRMTLDEARTAFPARWDPEGHWECADSNDEAFFARQRTVPPQPCVPWSP